MNDQEFEVSGPPEKTVKPRESPEKRKEPEMEVEKPVSPRPDGDQKRSKMTRDERREKYSSKPRRKAPAERNGALPPKNHDTHLVIAIRDKNRECPRRVEEQRCDHPACRSAHLIYNAPGLRLCMAHAPPPSIGSIPALSFENIDLLPFMRRDMKPCTEMRKQRIGQDFLQFMFACHECGFVCTQCAKRCYLKKHHLVDCRVGPGPCVNTKIQKIEVTYRISGIAMEDGHPKEFCIEKKE